MKKLVFAILISLIPLTANADYPTYIASESCDLLPENARLYANYTEAVDALWADHDSEYGQSCLQFRSHRLGLPYKNDWLYHYLVDTCGGQHPVYFYPRNANCVTLWAAADTDGDGILNGDDSYPDGPAREKNLGFSCPDCELATLTVEVAKPQPRTDGPINYATGNKYKRQVDFQINGPGLHLSYQRYYNSQSKTDVQWGYGWTASYSKSLSVTTDTIILTEDDGAQIHFQNDGTGTHISEADSVRKIVAVTGGHALTEPDGSILNFDSSGNFTQTTDRNGNSQTISYTDGLISVVSDNFGRQITFQYNAQSQLETLVTPIGDFTYTYDANNNLTRVDNPEGTFITYIYDDLNDVHNLTGIIDERNVRSHTAAYDTEDRAIVSEGANGHKRVDIFYNGTMTRQVTDSLGNVTDIELQEKYGIGRVKSSSGAGCSSCQTSLGESYELNDRLQMSQETDGEGNITSYTYDDRGNVLTKTEAVGTPEERTTTYTYHPDYSFVATIIRQSVGNPGSDTVTTLTYDANGNLTGTTVIGYSDGAQTSIATTMTYNGSGQITSVDGSKTGPADTVTYEYYPNDAAEGLNRGQLKKVIDPYSHETVFAGYNAFGKPQSVTDINGIITTLAYDAVGRLTHSTRNGQTTVYSYDTIGQLTSLDLPNGQQIVYTYDDAGNNTRITDKLGNYIAYTYNTEGKRSREEVHDPTDVLKKYTDFEYDTVNRLWKTIYPDTTYAELLYDNNNQVTQLTDANGQVTGQVYDALKRLTQVTQPGTTVTSYGYDAHDNLVTVTDAESLTTTYQYDDFGRVASETSPDTGTTSYAYDAAGNLTSKTDANGTVITYSYDLLNRLTGVSFTDAAQDITYTYDEGVNGLGRLTGMSDPSGTYVYGYNADGNLVSVQKTVDGVTYTTGYDYDEAGLLTGMTYPDGRTVTYERDGAGNVTRVTTTEDAITSVVADNIGYLPFGPLTNMTLGNGLTQTRDFDQLYRAASRQVQGFQDLAYSLDAVGNITGITDQIAAPASQTFGYDDLYRLTSATGSYGTIGYTYDSVGNRLTRTADGQTDTYAYEPGTHKLTGITGPGAQTFGYDAVGNITSRNSQSLIYNLNNRLIQITDQGTTVGEYVYNGKGQRIKKTVDADTTIYHYDLAGNLIGESDATGVFTAQFIYLGADRLAAVAATEASEVEVQVSTDAGRNLAGIKVYAFTDTGAYTGKYATTGDDGKATFTLSEFTDGDYKFRADYLGGRFWSPVIAVPGTLTTAVTIAEEATTVEVTQGGVAKEGVKVYLFNETGAYLGLYQTTDANGEVTFVLAEGQGYTFRADIMGGQFFSETVTVADGGTTLAIDSGGGILTLNLSKGVDQPMAGIKTYLFTAGGSYLGQPVSTDALGQAGYAVPSGSYKIRADYLGYQFWTNVTGVTADTGINLEIPHQDVVITVNGNDAGDDQPRASLKAYLFTPAGSYLGMNATTDTSGQVTFNLPAREYKVRADYLSQQFWSDVFIQQNTAITIPECTAKVLVTRLNNPLEGVPTYVFSESGSYLSLNGTSDADGNVVYRLPAGTYNFRGDYLGSQYFSGNTVLVADQANPVEISTGGGNFTLTVEKAPGQPMESIKCYLFTETGSYLGHTTTTNSQGEAPFELADGNYKIRTDYLGYQFWTPVFTVPDTGALPHTIAHSDVAVTVEKQNGAVSEAIEGVKVYLFTSSGSYQGVNSTTNAQGQVTFSLPAADYKVRADYLSGQYWSEVFSQDSQTITVSEGTASITVSSGGTDLEGVKVYVFTATGSYLGINGTTDVNGLVEFVLPAGDYKFRTDYQGSQYWVTETVTADQVNAIALDTGGGTFVLTVQKAAGVPIEDVPVYVFTPAGSYLGINARTDASGQVSFSLSAGSYMFRADYLGNQFWSSVSVVSEMLSDALTIEHTDVAVSVNEVYGLDSDPLEGITVYLFTESGAYQGQNAQTDTGGQVMFNLPDKAYKVRADYLGGQHWSDVFTSVDTTVDIDHGYANLHVTDTGTDVVDAPVYLFTETGSYLGRMQRTDAGGLTSFLVPAGAYKFRVDYDGTQYWSDVVNILDDEETVVDLALDLLALDGTRNPHPVRFDGTPPKQEPVLLASLLNITGILNQSVVAATGPDALYWFINDHLGTPQKVVDADQVVVWDGSQEPFGNTTVSADTLSNKFRFPGQYFDTESNLHYNYHRYYDPSIGRYLRADPIGLAGMDPNLYGYVLNNPHRLIDTDGRAWFIATAIIGGGAGAFSGFVTGLSQGSIGASVIGGIMGGMAGFAVGAVNPFGSSFAGTLAGSTAAGLIGGFTGGASTAAARGACRQEILSSARESALTGALSGALAAPLTYLGALGVAGASSSFAGQAAIAATSESVGVPTGLISSYLVPKGGIFF